MYELQVNTREVGCNELIVYDYDGPGERMQKTFISISTL